MRPRAAGPLVVTAIALAGLMTAPAARATTIPATVSDQTATTATTFTFTCCSYLPTSAAIGRSGASLASATWSGDFAFHPLRFENRAAPNQDDGDSTTRQLRSGRYAFYCAIHGGPGGEGMSGELYVAGPAAALKVSAASVAPGAMVTLDASATDIVAYANSLTKATYEFDPEGDGSFEPSGAEATRTVSYPAAGTFTPRVRVTDDTGRVDEASAQVTVAAAGSTPPPKQKAVAFGAVAKLPSATRCVSRKRGLRISVHDGSGADARSARLYVNGKLVKRVSDVGASSTLALRTLRGRPRVRLAVTLSDGRVVSKTVRYRVCAR
jgi:hypothetical protein